MTIPRVLLLDGNYRHTLQIATELSQDLQAEIIGVGPENNCHLHRSKYCDESRTISENNDVDVYSEKILNLVKDSSPDYVIPVGYHSTTAIDHIRNELSSLVKFNIPPSQSFRTSLNKYEVMQIAKTLDIDTPKTFSLVQNHLDEVENDLSYPIFLKAKQEAGSNITAIARTRDELQEKLIELKDESDDEILVQEYVQGDGCTYGCGVLYLNDEPKRIIGQKELRSVPRRGGSGTRVRLIDDPDLYQQTVRLLDQLGWDGIALVEFRKRTNGSYSLMEINPKFWASYPAASQFGHRFGTEMVATELGLNSGFDNNNTNVSGEMVFPIREIKYSAQNEEESIFESILSMIYPPSKVDINFYDLRAWLPQNPLRKLIKLLLLMVKRPFQ